MSEKKEGEKEELLRGKVFQMVVRLTMVLYTWKRGKKGEVLLKEKVLQSFHPCDHLRYGVLASNRGAHIVGYYLF